LSFGVKVNECYYVPGLGSLGIVPCDAPFIIISTLRKWVAVYPERSEGSHSCTATILLSNCCSSLPRAKRRVL